MLQRKNSQTILVKDLLTMEEFVDNKYLDKEELIYECY